MTIYIYSLYNNIIKGSNIQQYIYIYYDSLQYIHSVTDITYI